MTENKPQYPVEASELLFRAMTENSNDIIIGQDAACNITYVTPSIYNATNYSQEELHGKNLSEFLHPEDTYLLNAACAAVLENPPMPARADIRMKCKDGQFLWLESSVINMLGLPGVASVIVNMRDITFRKEAEQKILASELKFRSLIENSHDGIALNSAEGKMTYLSSAIKRVMGYAPEELLDTDPRLLSHPDDLEPVAKIIEHLYPRFGETGTAEYRMRHKNGEWRWIRSNITNMLRDENIQAFVFNYEDITDRKNTEARIRQSERMMADAQQVAHFGSWELDITSEGYGALRWSDEVFKIFGYAPGGIEVTIDNFFACVYPGDIETVMQAAAKAIAEKSRYSIDHRIVWPDGCVRWVHEDAQLMEDSLNAGCLKMTGTVRDITKQKDAEDRLLQSEANLKAIFDNTEIAYIMLDEKLTIVAFNPQAAKWVAGVYGETLFSGSHFLFHIKDNIEASHLKVLLKKVLEGNDIKFDYQAKANVGNEAWYLIRMNPVVLDHSVRGICISISDITLRKQHEIEREKITADLIQRNKDLEQFTYVISHNLRAPLTNIMSLADLLQEDGQAEDFQKLYKHQLSVSVHKMDTIIRDLNHVLQLHKGLSEIKQPVHFSGLVGDITLSIENIMKHENVTVITDFTAADEFVTIRSYIYSIFYNLITNSIKYRQPGLPPVIEISSTLSAKKLELFFKDNGLGIDLKRKGKDVFGLYKRFHHHIEGKGMGLFMVKTQVETLGGTISVESEINKGTKFTISFPVNLNSPGV